MKRPTCFRTQNGSVKMTKTVNIHNETVLGLDCIDLSYYIEELDIDDYDSVASVMGHIQYDYMNDFLPSAAMYFFRREAFHDEVFRAMDVEEFAEYLLERYCFEGTESA